MNTSEYKIVIVNPQYGDVYNFSYKDFETRENTQVLDGHIVFKSKILKKIYEWHFTNKINVPFKFLWNHKYFKNKFDKNDKIIFILSKFHQNIFLYGAIENLRKRYKNSKVVLHLNDLVEKSFEKDSFLKVCSKFDAIFSFDFNDCKKYNLYYQPLIYPKDNSKEHFKEEIDVYFCGRAKSRYNLIVDIFEKLSSQNIKCLFLIRDVPIKDRVTKEGLIYLDGFMTYQKNLEYLKRSKSILEIMQDGSNGYTLRTCEAVTFNKKLITNNFNIKKSDIYDDTAVSFFKDASDIDINFIKNENFKWRNIDYFSAERFIQNISNVLFPNKKS